MFSKNLSFSISSVKKVDETKISFTINGKLFEISPLNVPFDTSLNFFIRNHAKLSGTKFMCLEGGCGACVVTLKGIHPVTKAKTTWAVNSCLQNIYSCHGLDIITVEGIGSKKFGMHQVQKRLADFNGTQCGYCSPGMVMNMYSLLESKNGKVSMEEVENSFGGNICRCTGYRPILDAFKSLAVDADESLLKICKDIEDFDGIKTCPKTGTACSGKCSASEKASSKQPIQLTFDDDREWFKAYTVKDIFDFFAKIGDKPYMLVAGNTAHGVYRRSPDLKVFIDVSNVEELRAYKVNSDSLELGGNVTLTEAMEIFTKVAKENKNFEYLHELVKHIDLIANVPVRNNGTIAGNLMIKNAHKEFPSDIFLLLEAVASKVHIKSKNGVAFSSPLLFLNLSMNKKLLLKITLPSYDSSMFIFRSLKIMPRAQNAHAYVNAAFLFKLNGQKNKIEGAKICFGGIHPNFVHAIKTEAFLVGEDPFDNTTLQTALGILSDELNPDWVFPDASPEYRKNLALALFYKFFLNIAPDTRTESKFRSGGKVLGRELSSGTQVFDTYEKNWPLTKNIPKIEADVQCTGEAKYANDFPSLSNEVYGAFATAKKVHGKIASIDASRALSVPGVVAFYSAADIPGSNTFMPSNYLFVVEPEEIFCSLEVKYFNQPVGIVLAITSEIANTAADFVDISYIGEVTDPIITSLSDAIIAGYPRVQDAAEYNKAATSEGLQKVHKIKGRFEIAGQYHFTMENQTCVVIPIEDGLDVYSPTQWMDMTQIAIAEALQIPNNVINMHVRRLGGGFGAKISRATSVACAAAIAAYHLNRPVRVVLKIEANMNIFGKRYPCINDYEVETDADGVIQKLNNVYVEDYGSCFNEPAYLTTKFFSSCYESETFTVNAKKAKTDTASNTWCRGPGTLEGISMIENIMEHIARKTGKDPVDVRFNNINPQSEMKRLLPEFGMSVDYEDRKLRINEFNSKNRWIKKGISIVPMKFHVEYFGPLSAFVSIYHRDGSVALTVGGIEMGQGLNTKVVQTVAHILKVPLDKISLKPSNTLTAPNAIVTGASIGSEISCFAAKRACEILLVRLAPIKAQYPSASWSELIEKAYENNIDLAASYMYQQNDLKEYEIWAASCCEVEVDLLTGNIQVKRVDIMEDVGESMSPGVDVGQIEGGFVMGLGYWLNESLIYNKKTGELLTNRTWNYKPPGAKDIPIDFRVTFLKGSSNKFGVLRSKAVGEPPLCMSIVAIFAIRHALDSAREDSGVKPENDKYYLLGAPTTAETIFLSANNQVDQFLFKS